MKVWPWLLGGLGAVLLTAVAVPPAVALTNISQWLSLFGLNDAALALRSAIPPQVGANTDQWWRVLFGDTQLRLSWTLIGVAAAVLFSGIEVFLDVGRSSRPATIFRWLLAGLIVVVTVLFVLGSLVSV